MPEIKSKHMPQYNDHHLPKRPTLGQLRGPYLCNGDATGWQCEYYWTEAAPFASLQTTQQRKGPGDALVLKTRSCTYLHPDITLLGTERVNAVPMRMRCNRYAQSRHPRDHLFEDSTNDGQSQDTQLIAPANVGKHIEDTVAGLEEQVRCGEGGPANVCKPCEDGPAPDTAAINTTAADDVCNLHGVVHNGKTDG